MKKPEVIAKEIAEARNKKDSGRESKRLIMARLDEKNQREKDIEAGIVSQYYFLRDINTIPEISQNDSRFAEIVCNAYDKLPFNELCWLIRDIRYGIQKYQTDFEAGMLAMDSSFWDMINANVKSISITSDKGTIEITSDHPIFDTNIRLMIISKLLFLTRKIWFLFV